MPLLLCWRLNRHSIRNLLVKRNVPNRIHAGQLTSIKWEAENDGAMDVFGLRITDEINQVFSRNGEVVLSRKKRIASSTRGEVFLDRIHINDSTVSSYKMLFAERGVYEAGPAIVTCDFPMGLVNCSIKMNEQERIHVAPQVGILANNWKQIITSKIHGTAAQASVEGANGEEFFAVREFRSGDNKRKIHWRSTAKYQQPMVRQFERETEQDITIVLDLCADSTSSELASEFHDMYADCETVLSFAATVLSNWSIGDSSKLTIGIAGQTSEILSSIEIGQFTSQAMRALALANAGDGSHLQPTIESIVNTEKSGSRCLVISTRSVSQASRSIPATTFQEVRWVDCNSAEFKQVFKVVDFHQRQKPNSISLDQG